MVSVTETPQAVEIFARFVDAETSVVLAAEDVCGEALTLQSAADVCGEPGSEVSPALAARRRDHGQARGQAGLRGGGP